MHACQGSASAEDELADAETLIQRAIEIRKKAVGQSSTDSSVAALDPLGQYLLRWGDPCRAASPTSLQAPQIRRSVLGEDHLRLRRELLLRRPKVLDRRDRPRSRPEDDLSKPWASCTRATGKKRLTSSPRSFAASGRFAGRNGNMVEAEGLVRRSIEIYKRTCGESHPDHTNALETLASLLQKKGDLNQAEPIWQLLLDMKRQARGSQSLDCANIQTQQIIAFSTKR